MRPWPNGFGVSCGSLYDAGLSVSYMNNRFACVSSLTSRFGLVFSSVYSLVASGVDESLVKGLNHALSSVSTQLPDRSASALVTMRVLFLAGPLVIRIVNPTRSPGAAGFRCEPSAVSRLMELVVWWNETW